MKKQLATLLITALLFSTSAISFASEQEADETALLSFQPIVTAMNAFFTQNPKLLVKISPPNNLDKSAYFITHFFFKQSSYDIVTTNSIVRPYLAMVDVDTDVFDNKPCGNFSFDNRERDGWADAAIAIQSDNDQSCYALRTGESGPIRHRFTFSYQALEKKWSLSEILYQDGKPNGRFLVMLDIPSPWFPVVKEPRVRGFNINWYNLFKSLKEPAQDVEEDLKAEN